MEWTMDIGRYAKESYEEVFHLLSNLARIPAPSHHEEKRIAYIAKWLRELGESNIIIDDALNVIIPWGDIDHKPLIVFMAHTDVVFSDTDELPLIYDEQEKKLRCPGVADDTANVCVLLMAFKYLFLNNIVPEDCAILFVANSCEEGLGNLKGCRKIIEKYGERIHHFYTFDGTAGRVLKRSVGSVRYKVEVRTEGGHSYNAFGNKNAIDYLSAMIQDLYKVKVPTVGKTTYNVGTISGGTSVNTIAQNAEMVYEIRSDYQESIEAMIHHFNSVIECYKSKDITVNVEIVGERPCMGMVDEEQQKLVMQKAADALKRQYGMEAVFNSGSTDCNIPLSIGIPSTRLGTVISAGHHTREEWMKPESLITGINLALDLILGYVN